MKGKKPQFAPRRRSYMERAVDVADIRQRFLIVCEGSKTEPLYFKYFHIPQLVVDVKGMGMITLSLVYQALKLSNEGEYDQVWCVFDKDDNSIDIFENAIKFAQDNQMRVAYSNQAFELWYVLHFEYLHTAIDRSDYIIKLSEHLGHKYKKNNPDMYRILLPKMEIAIKNAKRLLGEYPSSQPGRDDPSTSVHELVIALLEQAKPLSHR